MMAPMGMPTLPMSMAEMQRRMAMVMMEQFWHLTHFQSKHFYHYVTQQGDTLATLSQRFGAPADQIRHWNCLPPSDDLPPGLMLTIPCEMKKM